MILLKKGKQKHLPFSKIQIIKIIKKGRLLCQEN